MIKSKENVISVLFIDWIIATFFAIAMISIARMPLALANENKAPDAGKHPSKAVSALAAPETGAPSSHARVAQSPQTSVDFLMEGSPALSQTSAGETSQLVPVTTPTPEATAVRLEVLQGTVVEEAEEVAMLVSEQCSQSGNAAQGTNACERVYSNGHHAAVLTQSANEGDEMKSQTVIEEFDGENTLLFKKTIRHRVDYNYLNDQKAKEKEFFDIIYQPVGKKTTRELMVYEYFLDSGKTRSLSWTQYKQIGSEPKAELIYNATLRYGADGAPDRGIAEQWNKGAKAETFLNWDRHSNNYATLDPDTWQQWEGWIRNVSLQAYLP